MGDDFPGNFYPNPDNYPETSFPQEVSAPVENPDDPPFITVRYNPDWTEVLMAAVDQLLQYSTWEGSDAEKIVAVEKANLLKSQLQKDASYMIRLNPVNCNLEQSQDGGETWTTVPGWDFFAVCVAAAVEGDFVNVPGDTMTGQLEIDRAGQANPALEFSYQGNRTHLIRQYPTYIRHDNANDSGELWYFTGANAIYMAMLNGQIDIRFQGVSDAPSGSVKMAADQAATVLSVQQHGAGDIARGWDSLGTLRFAVENSGRILGSALEAWNLSTVQLRQQAAIEPGWADDTDATRRSYLAVDLFGYGSQAEAMMMEYDPTAPQGVKIGAFGNSPFARPQIVVQSQTEALNAALLQLNGVGWTDIQYGGAPGELSGYDERQTCNAAYFVASQIAALINDIFDNLETVTLQEVLSDVIDTYNIPATYAEQVILQIQALWLSSTDVLDDLTDPDQIAVELLSGDFELQHMLDWIDSYITWEVQTRDIVHTVLEAIWPATIGTWTALGAHVDSGECGPFTAPCSDITYNLRWALGDVEITLGSWTQAIGIEQGFDDPNYRAEIEILFDNCTLDTVTVNWTRGDATQGSQLHLYDCDEPAGTTPVLHGGGSTGPVVDVFDNLAQHGPQCKILFRTTSINYQSGSTIQSIQIEVST